MLSIFLTTNVFSQEIDFSSYKYIVVSSKFEFVKERDGYQTSSLTKFLLKKKGFTVLLDNEEFPQDLSDDKCLALYASVLDDSNMFISRNKIQLRDCRNKEVYTSKEGKSKDKDYKRSYHEAIRRAFNSMDQLVYSFNPSKKKVSKEKKEVNVEKPIKIEKPKVEPKVVEVPKVKKPEVSVLKFQKNGFMINDSKRNETFTMLPSQRTDSYILISHNGLMYKRDGKWIVEFYKDGKLISLTYDLKI